MSGNKSLLDRVQDALSTAYRKPPPVMTSRISSFAINQFKMRVIALLGHKFIKSQCFSWGVGHGTR